MSWHWPGRGRLRADELSLKCQGRAHCRALWASSENALHSRRDWHALICMLAAEAADPLSVKDPPAIAVYGQPTCAMASQNILSRSSDSDAPLLAIRLVCSLHATQSKACRSGGNCRSIALRRRSSRRRRTVHASACDTVFCANETNGVVVREKIVETYAQSGQILV